MRDFTATSMVGPHATPAQTVNNQVVGCLYHVWYNLTFVEQDFPGKVWETLKPSIDVSFFFPYVGVSHKTQYHLWTVANADGSPYKLPTNGSLPHSTQPSGETLRPS